MVTRTGHGAFRCTLPQGLLQHDRGHEVAVYEEDLRGSFVEQGALPRLADSAAQLLAKAPQMTGLEHEYVLVALATLSILASKVCPDSAEAQKNMRSGGFRLSLSLSASLTVTRQKGGEQPVNQLTGQKKKKYDLV